MNTPDNTRISEQLLEEAGAFLSLLDERSLSPFEQNKFNVWLNRSAEHRIAFEQVASIWGKMDALQGLAEIIPIEQMEEANARHQGASNLLSQPFWGKALAASVFSIGILVAVMFYVGEKSSSISQQQTYVTHVGETRSIAMQDGSEIIANTDSQLSVLVTEKSRQVFLEKGEAFFNVEHDSERNFDVIVDDTIVRAVGTAFSVYRDDGELRVIVTEGVVEVIKTHVENPLDMTDAGSSTSSLLHPGNVAIFNSGAEEVELIEQDELARKLIWRQGMLAFEGEPLQQVIEEFNRYNNITLEIAEDDIRSMRVGGYFNSNDVAGMLTALRENFGIKVTHLSSGHVMLSKAEIP